MQKVVLEIKKFGQKGEKTGWTYLDIPSELAQKLNKGVRTFYKVKGKINDLPFQQTNLTPMGGGNYILALNAEIRRKLKLPIGEKVVLQIEVDNTEYIFNADLITCLEEDVSALTFFRQFPLGHQRYFSKWIDSAKSLETKSKRIAKVLQAMHLKQDYAQMIRSQKE